ncbi:MAG TPA: matrixin family metalloprotease [Bryobacteraceae bacterium]|nr:matrixin family metalloprotease [Bryobacteraceae bacterium]
MTKRVALLLSLLLGSTGISPAYYYFVRFNSRTGPYAGTFQKFDLTSLPNKTVTFFVSEQAPVQLAPNDSFPALISQLRSAAKVWNDVESSDLRINYGGLISAGTTSSTPSIEVVFDEVAPGLVATGVPSVLLESNGSFTPIQKSVIVVRQDLTKKPSWSEDLYGTLVHEFGHTLGLQHTLTSSVMSTGVTRATSKARPLAADDVAGISVLYPKAGFAAATAVITGRVTLNGQGVNLASVVALSTNGPAVSAMTNPDGTYRIEGLPPRNYVVYVHPLPPALQGETYPANIIPPADADRRSLPAGGPFETQFFPGTKDPQSAVTFAVTAGTTTENVNFSVRSRGPLQLHSVATYGYPANVAIKPPFLNPNISRPYIIAGGVGLVSSNAPAGGLSVNVMGSSNLGVKSYPSAADSFAQMEVDVRSSSALGEGPRHLLFSLNNDVYVLPAGFYQTEKQAPSVSAVVATGPGAALITGVNLFADTRIIFDGVPAAVKAIDENGRLTVDLPSAPLGYRAVVAALNSDGQSSLFLQGDNPPVYTYEDQTTLASVLSVPAIANAGVSGAFAGVSPSALPAGADAMIDIFGSNINFVDGQVSIGFGSSDIVVRRLWVVSPTHAFANISIAATAQPVVTTMTITSGLQIISQSAGFQIQPLNPRLVTIALQLSAAGTGASLVPGTIATLTVANSPTPISTNTHSLFLNDRPVPILGVAGSVVTFQVPPGLSSGPAVLRLDAGERGLPVIVQIDQAPQILGAANGTNQTLDTTRPARAGDLVNLIVSGLAEPGTSVASTRVFVKVAGVEVNALQVLALGNNHQVSFVLPAVASGSTALSVSVDGRTSPPFHLATR